MRIAAVALLASLAAASSVAHAAPPGLTEPDEEPPMVQPMPPVETVPVLHEKSPEFAAALSIGATSLGYLMMLGSHDNANVAETGALLAFLGPSTGQWYAHKSGALGLGARSVAVGIVLYAIVTGMNEEAACFDCGAGRNATTTSPDTTRDLLIAGAALWVGSTIYDIWAGYHETAEYNARARAINARILPMAMPTANNSVAPGVGYALRF